MALEVAGILGNRGAGKTAFMVMKLLAAYQSGVMPVTNMHSIKFPTLTLSYAEFRRMPPELENSETGWDELVEGADSYDFSQNHVRELTRIFAQIRKMHAKLYYTVQRWRMIPFRMRQLTDMWYVLEDLDAWKGEPSNEDGSPLFIDGKRVTHRDVCDGLFEVTELDGDFRMIRPPYVFDGKPIFDLYDTDETIEDNRYEPERKNAKLAVKING